MKHISLFSGIGGFELAAEWMGWDNVASCDINEFGNRVREYYWPDAYHHTDIHTLTYEILDNEISKRKGAFWRSDDVILTGGFPCQPYSTAGKRKGKDDDRHLFPEMLRVIRDVKPTYVVGENVFGLVSWNDGLVFHEVQSDLEAEGYEVQPFVLPAAAVNAPHRRDRVWFVAYSNKRDDRRTSGQDEGKSGEERLQKRNEIRQSVKPSEVQRNTSDTSNIRCNDRSDNRQERHIQDNINGDAKKDKSERSRWECRISEVGKDGNASDSNGRGIQARENRKILGEQNKEREARGFIDESIQGDATNTSQQQRSSREESHKQPTRFIQPDWSNFPTQPPICGRDDGLPTELDNITFSKWRNESIKAYGNAIVPQVALQIFKAIEQYDNNSTT